VLEVTRSNLEMRLDAAGLTAEQFAEIVGVDPKTVQRWVAGRTPHRRHRATAARALDTSEHDLWPDDVPAVAGGEPLRRGDVIASWATADDRDAPDLAEVVASAGGPVDVLDNANRLLCEDLMIAAVLQAASQTSPVRVLVDSPRRELSPLVGVEHLELRVAEHLGACAMIRAGDRILVLFDLVGQATPDQGQDTRPLLELSATTDAGLFARMADYFDDLCDQADEPVLSDPQLDEYLIDSPGIDEYTGEPSDDMFSSSTDADQPADPADHAAPETTEQAPSAPPARRWPRRPD
jgi:transcriptional regulator with XRE-family HTH domain